MRLLDLAVSGGHKGVKMGLISAVYPFPTMIQGKLLTIANKLTTPDRADIIPRTGYYWLRVFLFKGRFTSINLLDVYKSPFITFCTHSRRHPSLE